ncbi:acid phosphatase [Collimonas sp. OK607]|uniref:acid phosphatase n=1 Tax=Collimonas sp. OK607 TaxID=1798194 RepID=UPI0008DEFE98|nr:acid phosphatase [Collimonas sp. OK607]SFB13774.1 acid phosphatase [Collimonas sp. OK607]
MNENENEKPELTEAHDDETAGFTRRRFLGSVVAVGASLALSDCASDGNQQIADATREKLLDQQLRSAIKHVVVIYAENRSFNNLYGNFPGVQRPLAEAMQQGRYTQLDRDGKTPLAQLPKIWGGLVPQAQQVNGQRYVIAEGQITGLPNAPFKLSDQQGKPLPQGVITRDLWHKFYQNQMQINGGKNDQFVAWADSGALTMGHYGETASKLRLWKLAEQYTLCDNFFMSAFGGSYLNHIFLISGQTPFYPDVHNSPARHNVSTVEGDDPKGTRLKLDDKNPASAIDGPPKFLRDRAITPDGYAVNTMAPPYQPSFVKPPQGGDAAYADAGDPMVLPPQTYPTIGDRLSEKGVSWAWYSGAWQAALDGTANSDAVPNFQYHHQPFNYFKSFAPGTALREAHLKDAGTGDDPNTNKFLAEVDAGRLPQVSFYKPQGNLNLHAGYADVESGDRHIANVIAHLQRGPQWQDMVVIITHDENGGWWDHVAPPKGDRWGPGSRIPATVISPYAKKGFVDHTVYDTTSIMRFITRLHGLRKLDALVARDEAFKENGQAPLGDLSNTLDLA